MTRLQRAKTFRSRVTARRTDLGMTQAQLAQKCGLHPAAISHFETGQRRPCIENLARLALELDCTSDYLIGLR